MEILFIEDDPMNRRVISDMLDVVDIPMTGAESGEFGLAQLEQNDFAAVLLDLRMPGMDGFEVLHRIRSRKDAKAGIPVIVITADTAPGLKERCFQSGADDVLFKPIIADTLYASIGRALAKSAGDVVVS